MDSMFTAREAGYHKHLKSSVSQIFSMTNMKNFEIYTDECTRIFINAMLDLEGELVDFSKWLQWYAFDVIGSITFQRRFGFLEERRDVDNMIGKIDTGLQYVKILGQFPFLIPGLQKAFLNSYFQRLNLLPDTMDRFIKVGILYYLAEKAQKVNLSCLFDRSLKKRWRDMTTVLRPKTPSALISSPS